ncbi:MAG: cytochrome b/b6 domain-containing protein [Rhodobacteraceae bacterium]|nr:cytochrome b/b6 domain-containing protein [Paracoccaceae bacterium]
MPQPFSRPQIAFHWISAALVLLMAATGMMYFLEIADRTAMQVHQISGQILILVLIGRLIVKARAKRRTVSDHAAWERGLALLVQIALYLALIVAVVTGYVSVSAFSSNMLLFPVDIGFARSDTGEQLLEVHYLMKWVFLGLIGLHVAGALKHHLIDRDNTLRHMISFRT